MREFLRVRFYTFISTCIITYIFTGDLFFTSTLSLTLIGVNTIIMYFVLRKDSKTKK